MRKILITILTLIGLLTYALQAKEVSIEEKITGLYVAFFERAADKEGLDFWRDRADSVGGDSSEILKELSSGFAQHELFISKYSDMNNSAFVEAIYRNTLGQEGDVGGILYWTALLDTGMSRSDMVSDFVEGSLALDLTVENFPTLSQEELAMAQKRQDLLSNKVDVAVDFTQKLGEHTNIQDADDIEKDPAYVASTEIISHVTDDNSTVDKVKEFVGGKVEKDSFWGEDGFWGDEKFWGDNGFWGKDGFWDNEDFWGDDDFWDDNSSETIEIIDSNGTDSNITVEVIDSNGTDSNITAEVIDSNGTDSNITAEVIDSNITVEVIDGNRISL